MGDCFAPRLAVLRHRNRIRVSALSGAIAIALVGCNRAPYDGKCVNKTTGVVVAAKAEHDVDSIAWWDYRDPNGIIRTIDRDNSDRWVCTEAHK